MRPLNNVQTFKKKKQVSDLIHSLLLDEDDAMQKKYLS